MKDIKDKVISIALIFLFIGALGWLMLSDFPKYTPEEIRQREEIQEKFRDYITYKILFG